MEQQNNQPENVNVNGVDYKIADLTDQQKAIISHISATDQRLNELRFQIDGESIKREALFAKWEQTLEPAADEIN